MTYTTSDFDYDLPEDRIAQEPWPVRDECKLLVMDRATGALEDRIFRDIIDYIEPGDVLEPVKGTDVAWLQYRGPGQQQFEHLLREQSDIDTVSGRSDVAQGQRPGNIESASAIRALQSAANIRVEGKMPGAHDAWCLVVRKAPRVIAKKARGPLQFVGSGGRPIRITPAELDMEYEIRKAEGSGQSTAKRDREGLAVQLYQLGLLTPDVVLEAIQWPNWQETAQKVMAWQLQQKQIEAAAMANRLDEAKSGEEKK